MYECGHKPKKISIKKNDLISYIVYNQWKESGSALCFDCWNKKRKKEFLRMSKEILTRNKKENIPLTDPRIN